MNKGKNRPARRAGAGADKSPDQITISGGFLQIFGLGVLIIGHSGIGKSESALELISRGHRFISDDVVEVRKGRGNGLVGRSPLVSRYFMEIRGLGIINIKEIFGPRAICRQSRVDLVIKLRKWQRGDERDRLGLEFPEDYEILGTKISQLIVPVAPGRTIALLIEVACKVHLLRLRGYHASHEIVKRVDRTLLRPKGKR